MACDFQVGDEVVCVDDTRVERLLALGKTYRISYVGPGAESLPPFSSGIFVAVEGVICPCGVCGRDGLWFPQRFRKVQRKFTGMEELRGLLKTKPLVKVPEPV